MMSLNPVLRGRGPSENRKSQRLKSADFTGASAVALTNMTARQIIDAEDPKAFFKQTISATPRTYTPRQLTPREMERLSVILASGPVPFRPFDQRFIDWGWVEFYDDNQHDAVVGKSGFTEFFYGKNGSPRPQFAEPLYRPGRVMTYYWPKEALVESSGGGFIIDAATGRVLRRQLDEGFEGYARIESFDLNEWREHYQWKGPMPHGFSLLDLAWRTADGMAESADEEYREIFGQLAQPEQQTVPPQR